MVFCELVGGYCEFIAKSDPKLLFFRTMRLNPTVEELFGAVHHMWTCQESANGLTIELRNSPSVATVESTMSASSFKFCDFRMAQNACSFVRFQSCASSSSVKHPSTVKQVEVLQCWSQVSDVLQGRD